MSTEHSFERWQALAATGADEAARQVFERFAHRLIGLARTRLDERLRQKVDPEDILQSTLKSFFARQANGQFVLSSWDSLWALLTVITLRKCAHRREQFQRLSRDLRRELPPPASDDSGLSAVALAREPTPEEAATLADTVADIFRRLTPREAPVLELTLQGFGPAEVADKLGVAERTVFRSLERIRGRLERVFEAPEE